MKLIERARNSVNSVKGWADAKVATVVGLATLGATSSHAALPTGVSDAITTYQTDATAAIGLIMAAGVVIWGLMKLASKLGWR